jgi:hypothetical protein
MNLVIAFIPFFPIQNIPIRKALSVFLLPYRKLERIDFGELAISPDHLWRGVRDGYPLSQILERLVDGAHASAFPLVGGGTLMQLPVQRCLDLEMVKYSVD